MMPPIVTGNFNITSNCTINNTIKRIPYLEAVRNSFACKSKNTGIAVKRHSMTMLSFRKTEILVIDKIRSFVLGSKIIYIIPTFSKCFFNNFLPIKPPIMAHIIVPKIIRGITHQFILIALMIPSKEETSPFLRMNSPNCAGMIAMGI